MQGKRKATTQKGGRKKKTREEKRFDRLTAECSGNMTGIEAREQLDMEVAIRASAKEVAPLESRHAPELLHLIGPAPRQPPSPIRINSQYARFLRGEDSEAEDGDEGEEGREPDGIDATFFPTPSLKEIKAKKLVLDEQERQEDLNWYKLKTGLVRNAARSRPKGTWSTYEDKQQVYKVSWRFIEDLNY
jgi:hypothetical protein